MVEYPQYGQGVRVYRAEIQDYRRGGQAKGGRGLSKAEDEAGY
jgi:hypothetical protein